MKTSNSLPKQVGFMKKLFTAMNHTLRIGAHGIGWGLPTELYSGSTCMHVMTLQDDEDGVGHRWKSAFM